MSSFRVQVFQSIVLAGCFRHRSLASMALAGCYPSFVFFRGLGLAVHRSCAESNTSAVAGFKAHLPSILHRSRRVFSAASNAFFKGLGPLFFEGVGNELCSFRVWALRRIVRVHPSALFDFKFSRSSTMLFSGLRVCRPSLS